MGPSNKKTHECFIDIVFDTGVILITDLSENNTDRNNK